jgi:hypothetical protein
MHSLIDSRTVDLIRTTGNTNPNLPDRAQVLESLHLPYDQPADQVIITGCQNLGVLPGVIEKLGRILQQGGMKITFLSKEYCCGNYLYRPAIKAKDEQAMAECRSLSREFVGLNVEQARRLGAKRLIVFCSPCYPIFKQAFPEADIIFYPQAIKEAMGALKYRAEIDYYPGCYRLHKKFAPVPMDLKSTDEVLESIKELSVNRISAPACCFKPEGMDHMINSLKTETLVHICTGCYFQALQNIPRERQVQILMLPEFICQLQEQCA